jgi:hypothetical protein
VVWETASEGDEDEEENEVIVIVPLKLFVVDFVLIVQDCEEEEDEEAESTNHDPPANLLGLLTTLVSEAQSRRPHSRGGGLHNRHLKVREHHHHRGHSNKADDKAISCGKCRQPISRHEGGTWSNGWICDNPSHSGVNSFPSSTPVWGCATIMRCNWGMCETCFRALEGVKRKESGQSVPSSQHTALMHVENRPIAAHYAIIQLLNVLLQRALPFINLASVEHIPGSLSFLLLQHRGLIFECLKTEPFNRTVEATAGAGGQFDLLLSRSRARKHSQAGLCDVDGRFSVFSQAFRVLHHLAPATLRRTDRLYSTKFMGEHAQDAGGPYRETFASYCAELQSSALPLMLRTPNGRHAVGMFQIKYVNLQCLLFDFVQVITARSGS